MPATPVASEQQLAEIREKLLGLGAVWLLLGLGFVGWMLLEGRGRWR